jgi:hypothetical protein
MMFPLILQVPQDERKDVQLANCAFARPTTCWSLEDSTFALNVPGWAQR